MAIQFSKPLTAAILSDFAQRYNERWNEDWRVDIRDFVEIYRPGLRGKWCCEGFFMESLFAFCNEHFGQVPCLSCFNEEIRFYL